jgi:hypothetical protein
VVEEVHAGDSIMFGGYKSPLYVDDHPNIAFHFWEGVNLKTVLLRSGRT